MGKSLILGTLLLVCAGCVPPPIPHQPVRRELAVPESPDVAYVRAVKATMAVGGAIHQQDRQLRMINAQVQRVVTLNVLVTPEGSGARVNVTGQIPPTHALVGSFTLVDDWIAAYQHQP